MRKRLPGFYGSVGTCCLYIAEAFLFLSFLPSCGLASPCAEVCDGNLRNRQEGLASSSACGGTQKGKAKRLARAKPIKKKARKTRGDPKAKRARRGKATDDTGDEDGTVDNENAAGSAEEDTAADDSAGSMPPRLASLNEAAVVAR